MKITREKLRQIIKEELEEITMEQQQDSEIESQSSQPQVQPGSFFQGALDSQDVDPALKQKIEDAIENAKPNFGSVITDKMIADQLSKMGLSGREILDLANAGGRKEPKPVPQLKPGAEMTSGTSVLGDKYSVKQ